jgi:predicted RNase H-like HicB family nuclease
MKLHLLVQFDPEAKRWSAVFPELPGCATAGDTEAEAVENAREALASWFESAPVKLAKGDKILADVLADTLALEARRHQPLESFRHALKALKIRV